MSLNKPYPIFNSDALPALPAPHSRHPIVSWYCMPGGRSRVRIPPGLWSLAGVDLNTMTPRAATFGRYVIVVWAGALWESLGSLAQLAWDSNTRSLTTTRTSALDIEHGQMLLGDGYFLVVPGPDAAAYEKLPLVSRYAGQLTDASIAKAFEPLPREKALGFKQYAIAKIPKKECRFIGITGYIWEAAGMKIGDAIQVTRFQDGVRITKAVGDEHDGILVARVVPKKGVYPLKRFGEAVLGSVRADTVRVVFTKDALMVLGDAVKLSDFGLGSKALISGTVPMQDGEFHAKPKNPRKFAVYPLDRQEPRIQVQGDWLERFGFVPGIRFTVESHPTVRGRMLARIDAAGEHTVTQHRPGHPGGKLYIPTRFLQHFTSKAVRVWGSAEGLQVQRHSERHCKAGD